jgi:hypothetical protein
MLMEYNSNISFVSSPVLSTLSFHDILLLLPSTSSSLPVPYIIMTNSIVIIKSYFALLPLLISDTRDTRITVAIGSPSRRGICFSMVTSNSATRHDLSKVVKESPIHVDPGKHMRKCRRRH